MDGIPEARVIWGWTTILASLNYTRLFDSKRLTLHLDIVFKEHVRLGHLAQLEGLQADCGHWGLNPVPLCPGAKLSTCHYTILLPPTPSPFGWCIK